MAAPARWHGADAPASAAALNDLQVCPPRAALSPEACTHLRPAFFCSQHTAFDGDQTAFARVKDFYVPKPPLRKWEGEKAKPPGFTITPREWQKLLEEGSAEAPGPIRRASFGHDPGQDNVEVLLDGTCRRVCTVDRAPCSLSPRGLLAVAGPAPSVPRRGPLLPDRGLACVP